MKFVRLKKGQPFFIRSSQIVQGQTYFSYELMVFAGKKGAVYSAIGQLMVTEWNEKYVPKYVGQEQRIPCFDVDFTDE